MQYLVDMFKHDNYKIRKLYVIVNMKGMAVEVSNGVSDRVANGVSEWPMESPIEWTIESQSGQWSLR